MVMIRAFFAVPLGAGAEQQLAACCQRLHNPLQRTLGRQAVVRWVEPRNYHLTLAFLGNIHHRQLEQLERIARSAVSDFRADCLQLASLAWFPGTLKPRLIAALPEHNQTLEGLQGHLAAGLRREGFQLQQRAFKPHVTLARVRSVAAPAQLAGELPSIESIMDEVVLFKSEQSKAGVSYTPLLIETLGARQ